MKRYIIYVLLCLLLPIRMVAQTSGYDPVNPPDPRWPDGNTTQYYTVSFESIPYGAGRFNMNNYTKFAPREQVSITAQDHDDCYFICWKDPEGNEVTTNHTLQFIMPESDVKYYAIYSYNPGNPSDPVMAFNYMLSVKSEPVVAGYFNFQDKKVLEGTTQNLYAYANSGFKFVCWKDADGFVLSTNANLNYLMPAHASTLTAYYEYDPENPMQQGTNVWDKEAGELIIDYFNPGYLLSAMDNMVGSSNRGQVTHFIVDGEINDNDWGFPYYYKNLTYIDFSRTNGSSIIPSRWLENYTDIQEVELPACITQIREYAFNGCTSMRAIDCYATVPPVVSDGAFNNLPTDMVVYVPDESIDLYEANPSWNIFTISPLKSKVCTVELRLPEECKDGRYKNASLELVNVKSGQRYKYVITDRLNYTFTNIIRNTKQQAYVKNLTGDIICKSEVITVDEDNEVYTFEGMKMPYDVTLRVQKEGAGDITDKVNVTWKLKDETFLCQGAKVEGQLEGAVLRYSIGIPADVAAEYYAPESGEYTVVAGENQITVVLKAIPSVICKGVVVDEITGKPVSGGAHVVFEQQTDGGTVSVSATTDSEGKFSLTSKVLPTTVRISTDINVTLTQEYTKAELEALVQDGNADFGSFTLLRLKGVTAYPIFKYTPATYGESSANNYFPYQENVSYTLYNKTTNQDLTDVTQKGKSIYILSGAQVGDEIQATCSSTNGKFAPVTVTETIVENTLLTFQFPVKEYGKVFARFLVTDNNAVEGLLYDAAGHLVKRETYNTNFTPTESDELGDLLDHNKTPNFIYLSDLPAGDYTLITMGKSSVFSTLSTLSGYTAAGLKAGEDYVRNDITIQDGVILPIRNVVIPVFEESKFYRTGENTKFSVNKANIVEGNYLTLSAKVDFQDAYKQRVSDVELVCNLHATCPIVENSVVVGNRQSPYEYRDNTVTIPLGENYTDRVKFCIAPTSRGNYSPDAYVRFKLDGNEVLQPIGSVNYTVTDVSIWTAPLISLPSIFVDGNAAAMSDIIVYDRGKELGSTKALADGYWSLTANLTDCANLSIHEIQAKVTSPSGLVRQTEMRPVEYNQAGIQAKDVDMRFYNPGAGRTVWVDFDLEHVKANVKSYSFIPNTEFVFTANLTNNDPDVVHSCVIHVFTIEHEWIDLKAQYIPNMDRWVAHGKFDANQAPMAVRVTVDADLNPSVPYEIIQVSEAEQTVFPVEGDIFLYVPDGQGFHLTNVPPSNYTQDPDADYSDIISISDENGEEKVEYGIDMVGNVLIEDKELNQMIELVMDEETDNGASVRPYKAPIATEAVTRLKERIVALEATISLVNTFVTNPDVAQEKLEIVRSLNTLTRYLHDGIKDVNAWQEFISRLQPCDGMDDAQAKAMLWISEEYKNKVVARYLSCCNLADAVALLAMINNVYDANDVLAKYLANVSFAIYKAVKTESRNEIRRCKRLRNTWDCNYAVLEEIDDVWDASLPYPIVEPVIDPSGFVYEGVSSNRLEGVTATAYYKHTYHDEYGDMKQEIVLWDASQYSQENPLYTDAEGLYSWDVPQGLWQVKFEKAGYQTTYSEWLPVPPPQMDVNVGMVQASQPQVVSARAYEAGETTEGSIEITFDKYMKPATLTADNIYIKGIKGEDETLLEAGEFTFPDMEAAIEGSDDMLATKVCIATTDLSTFDEVYLIVNRDVESYAGICMTEVYNQKLDVEKKLTALVVDSLINVGYGESRTVRIAALPTVAAAGKKVVVTTASTITANIGENAEESITVTLDADGQAEIQINGVLYGTTALKMEVLHEDIKTTAMVAVVDTELLQPVKAPAASHLSGTSLYAGQAVTLTCESKGASIYYTTDGSCPCDSQTRQLYTKPISVTEDVTLKIMSVSYQGEESEIVEYNYYIRQSEVTLSLAKGWNWVSHDLASPLAVNSLEDVASEVLTQEEQEFVAATSSMKISAPEAGTRSFQGAQYNPTLDEIVLNPGWNWLGYPIGQMLTLEDAFSYLDVEDGDVISNLEDGFSVFSAGKWVGDIKALRPGQGYLYKSQSRKAFVYNTVPTVNAQALYGHRASTLQSPWKEDVHKYADMMCVIANLYQGNNKLSNPDWLVGAFVGDECRGMARFTDGEIYLPVRGQEGEEITIQIISLSSDAGSEMNEHVDFQADVVGTVESPLRLTLSDPNGLILMGDVNDDGEVDLSDAIMVTYYSLHEVPSNFNESVADMNGDGEIDLSDAIIITYKSLGVK